jgi:hypothetical protein
MSDDGYTPGPRIWGDKETGGPIALGCRICRFEWFRAVPIGTVYKGADFREDFQAYLEHVITDHPEVCLPLDTPMEDRVKQMLAQRDIDEVFDGLDDDGEDTA